MMFGHFFRARTDDDMQGGEETPAIRYVRNVIATAINRGLSHCEITADDGLATCDLVADRVPYGNVRNRIAIMTDSIRSYDNRIDQFGNIKVRVPHFDCVIAVEDRAERGGIRLTLSTVLRPFDPW